MEYYDQTGRHDSPATNASDVGTLLILFVYHEQVFVPVWIEPRTVGEWILLVHESHEVAMSRLFYLFIFFVFLGTLKAADRDTHFRWSIRVSEFESSGVSIVFPHWSQGEWGVWSLRFLTETPIGSVGCINWCKNVSRQYLSMIKGKLGIVMTGCYFPDFQGRVDFYRRVKDGIFSLQKR